MRKFRLTASVTISVYTEVEAETLDEAIKLADQRSLMDVVKSGGNSEKYTWMCDELDGTPYDIHES
jgi:hypothetical protein